MSGPVRIDAHVDRQVPLGVRLAYGIGSVADGVKNVAFNAFLVLYYTTVLGLPGTLSGLAIFIALCVDAITDPLVGSLSDNFRSRWGRRHPFMLFAALPMAVCMYCLFSPPAGLSETGLFGWLTAFAIGVRIFLTFYMVPSSAMAPEMTTHYDERTTLNSFRWLLGWVGSLVLASVGWFYFLADAGEQVGEGRLQAANYPAIGAFAAGMVFLAIVISTFGTAKLIPKLRRPDTGRQAFSLSKFLGDLRAALRSHSLRILLGSSLLASAALGVSEVLGTYMNTWFWEASATYMMGVAYPEDSDWSRSIDGYTDSPWLAMDADNRQYSNQDAHMYGMALWNFYLDEHVGGPELIRRLWEHVGPLKGLLRRSWARFAGHSGGCELYFG